MTNCKIRGGGDDSSGGSLIRDEKSGKFLEATPSDEGDKQSRSNSQHISPGYISRQDLHEHILQQDRPEQNPIAERQASKDSAKNNKNSRSGTPAGTPVESYIYPVDSPGGGDSQIPHRSITQNCRNDSFRSVHTNNNSNQSSFDERSISTVSDVQLSEFNTNTSSPLAEESTFSTIVEINDETKHFKKKNEELKHLKLTNDETQLLKHKKANRTPECSQDSTMTPVEKI